MTGLADVFVVDAKTPDVEHIATNANVMMLHRIAL
jgi:hypothetical protein